MIRDDQLFLSLAILASACCSSSSGAVIYKSATLGAAGIPREDVGSQAVLGASVNASVFQGVRLELPQPVRTTEVGGHFVGPFSNEDTVFGALVALSGQNDFPDSVDLSTADVLGATLLNVPLESADTYGELELMLQPDWYALVFGSGLFGAEGRGGALLNNHDLGDPSYISWQPGSGWTEPINPIFRNYRFVVKGTVVPEPNPALS